MRLPGTWLGLIAAALLWVSDSAFADTKAKECLDPDKYQKQFNYFKFHINYEPDGRLTESTKFDPCDSSRRSYKLLKALMKLDELDNLTRGNREFDQNIVNSSPAEFLRSRVKKIVLESSVGGACGKGYTVGYTNLTTREPTMWVCPYASDISTLGLMGILIHEARHLDGKIHVTCAHGGYSGSSSCDHSYQYKGSYAVETELYIRVSKTEALPLWLRQDARAQAAHRMLNNFYNLPFGLKNGFLTLDFEGTLTHVSVDGRVQPVLEIGESSIPILLGDPELVIFEPDKALVQRYSFSEDLHEVGGSPVARAFKKEWTPAERQSLRDVYWGPNYSCALLDRELRCMGDKKTIRVEVGSFDPLYFVDLHDRLGFSTREGDLFFLPKDFFRRGKDVRVGELVQVQNPYRFVNVVPLDQGRYIGLTIGGQVLVTEKTLSRAVVIEFLRGKRQKKVLGPYIWSKKLEEM